MARNCGDERWENSNSKEAEAADADADAEAEEEEEALSLCDLPVNLVSEENRSRNEKEAQACEIHEDFNFGSWGGSLSTEQEMCAADEVFFQGQILPLRNSVSSETGSARFRPDSQNPISRSNSRSESMDYRNSIGFSSISSRSSSIGSHHSSSSSSTTTTIITTTTTTATTTNYKPKIRNQFHTHPSPTPQIRLSVTRHGNVAGRSRKSTIWDILRLGLVRTPEIELQDLKLRTNSNATNKSFGSRNSNSSSNDGSCSSKQISKLFSSDDGDKSIHELNTKKKNNKKKQRFFAKDVAFLSGCKCSTGAVETVSSRIVIIKSGTTGSGNNVSDDVHAIKEKQQQMRKQTRQQQGKQTVSRHRTFEWLKELSLEAQLGEA